MARRSSRKDKGKKNNRSKRKHQKKRTQFDNKVMTRISDLKKISGKGGLSLSDEELTSRYDLLSKHCGFNDADIAKDVAQISGIDPLDKDSRRLLTLIWDSTKQKNILHKEIDYLETYLSDGIDKEIEIRSCPPRI